MLLRVTSSRFLLISLLCLLPVFSVRAITVSPVKLELSGDPGTVVRGEFKIFNEQSEAQVFYSDFENFQAQDESGAPSFVGGGIDLASWIVAPREIRVRPNEIETVPFSIAIPANAEPGGHFAAIFLGTGSGGGGQVSISGKVGILILLRVSGLVKEGGDLLQFDTQDQTRVFSALPVGFFYRFQNSGSDRVKPTGDLVIKNIFGGVVTAVNANVGGGNVLPQSIRRFEFAWSGDSETVSDSSAANAGFLARLRSEWSNFAFGRYTANLALVYGGERKAVVASTTFWVFPWRLLLTILILLVVLWLVLGFIIRRYNRWIIAQALLGQRPSRGK